MAWPRHPTPFHVSQGLCGAAAAAAGWSRSPRSHRCRSCRALEPGSRPEAPNPGGVLGWAESEELALQREDAEGERLGRSRLGLTKCNGRLGSPGPDAPSRSCVLAGGLIPSRASGLTIPGRGLLCWRKGRGWGCSALIDPSTHSRVHP